MAYIFDQEELPRLLSAVPRRARDCAGGFTVQPRYRIDHFIWEQ
jgi:hypothetical protein